MSELAPLTQPIEAPDPEVGFVAQLKFHHLNEFGKPINLDPSMEARSEQAFLNFRSGFNSAIDQLPSHTENLNVGRVNGFMKERGIEPSRFVVIDREELPRVGALYKEHLTKNGMAGLFDASEFDPEKDTKQGWHDAMSGLTIVIRPYMKEIENGAVFTESIAVHELFHAASDHGDIVIAYDDSGGITHAGNARTGLSILGKNIPFSRARKDTNYFLEEAGASYLEGQYKKEFASTRLKRPIEPGKELNLPYEYTRLDGGMVVAQNAYGNAGYALDLMIQEKPELFDAIVGSRTSSKGLKDVARIVEDIKPGLYSSLSRIDPTRFREENLNIIRSAINGEEDNGHEILRTEGNPEGRVEHGFVSNGERVTYRAANRRRKAGGRLARVIRKSLKARTS